MPLSEGDTINFLVRIKTKIKHFLVKEQKEGGSFSKGRNSTLEDDLALEAAKLIHKISNMKLTARVDPTTRKMIETQSHHFENVVEHTAAQQLFGHHARTTHPPKNFCVAMLSQLALLYMDKDNYCEESVAAALHSCKFNKAADHSHGWAEAFGSRRISDPRHQPTHFKKKHPNDTKKHTLSFDYEKRDKEAIDQTWMTMIITATAGIGVLAFMLTVNSDSPPEGGMKPKI